ncbi:MAG TPA: MoaD/ThiS family protein [Desulfatiglandales bacterium]|nr:MoaD/ThiS family protein [Desulfatiglandales bacterium]
MIGVKIHTTPVLKKIVGQRELEVSLPQGSTLEALLSWMVDTWGEKIAFYLFHPGSASPLPHVRLMINGQDIGFLDGMETVLQDGDEILIIALVGGG